jgi:hypothetical protein
MAASEKVLAKLHEAVAKALLDAMEGDSYEVEGEDGEETEVKHIPPSAAIIQAATKFLKDNNVTCTPADDNALGDLQKKMEEKRKLRTAKPIDLEDATAQSTFLNGLN